jgi:tuftelin-interacting protein 11
MSANDEYEGGQWVDGEFYPDKVSKNRGTKDDAIYGVFGDDEGQQQRNRREGGGGGRNKNKNKNNYGKADSMMQGGAIKFVSTGELPSAMSSLKEGKEEAAPAEPGEAVLKAPPKAIPVGKVIDKDFGKFERHTKGFGLKMLMKMGFNGRLGKTEQGLVNPVQAKQRPKGMGLSFNNFSERNDTEAIRGAADEEKAAAAKASKKPATEDVFESREVNWKKGKSKQRTVYKTAADVTKKQQPGIAQGPDKYQIVDMRGPNVKILSSDQIATLEDDEPGWTPTASARSSQLPELQHNLRILVEMTEEDIEKIDREILSAGEGLQNMTLRRDRLAAHDRREKAAIQQTTEVMKLVGDCQEKVDAISKQSKSIPARLQIVSNTFHQIRKTYPQEWKAFNIAALAEPMLFPLFKAYFHNWDPLAARPSAATADWQSHLAMWKLVLSNEFFDKTTVDIYRELLDDTVVPVLRLVLSLQWNPRNYNPLIALLDQLRPLFPANLYDDVCAHAIAPRLRQAVEEWNPRVDTVPIHTWIKPWTDVLQTEDLEPIYKAIRYKLAIVLQDWHAADVSALTVISPWVGTFKANDMEMMLARCILPKLHQLLRTKFTVNPHQQDVEPFQAVMGWVELFPQRVLLQLLRQEFFPRWLQALHTWLSSAPDLDEVRKWYLGWKHMIPAPLRAHPNVVLLFNRSIDLMNQMLEYPNTPPTLLLDAILADLRQDAGSGTTEKPKKAALLPKKFRRPVVEEPAEMSFKDIVTQYALVSGVDFVPNLKRGSHEGKPIYTFGKVTVCLDKTCIYASLQDPTSKEFNFVAIGMQDLLGMAR